ncbi:hypothetical protein TNCV_3729371 [Trichonephila clavipes]|nr:hypothetical protein TNCV_3729371 [Trichonephila clavipes]
MAYSEKLISAESYENLSLKITDDRFSLVNLGSKAGESMDVCKCLVPLKHGTSNSHRAASPLVKLVEGEERWETPNNSRYSPSKLGFNQGKLYRHLQDAQSYS